MTRKSFHLISAAIFILAILLAGRFPAHTDSTGSGRSLIFDASYRSRSSYVHKVIVQASDHEL
ncbi:MAG: hypothetical protein WAU45_13430, partial [Blastocatellia bacterium]